MATTFEPKIYADLLRKDGTYNVKIRITHNSKSTKVSTPFYACKEDLKRNTLDLKNQFYIDGVRKIIKRWTGYLSDLDGAECVLSVTQLVDYFKKRDKQKFEVKEEEVFRLDFIKFGFEVAASKSEGTARGYICSLNALERFLNGRTLDVNDITVKFLQEFEFFIKSEPVMSFSPKDGLKSTGKSKLNGRAASSYAAHIRHIFNEAKRIYNNEGEGAINIPRSPFDYYRLPKLPKRKFRCIELETLQHLINLPDRKVKDGIPVDIPRRDLVRDCFLLSFGLAGMNAADLYDCPADALVWDEVNKCYVIVYYRKKTRTRRDDEAEIHVRVEPFLMPLVEKYRDPQGEYLFYFARRYSTPNGFNAALRLGIVHIVKDIGLKYFTFYSGRHTWATVGRSKEVNIDKGTIDDGLNHKDEGRKLADLYAKKDYSLIWEANAKILNQLDWSELVRRENLRREISDKITKDEPDICLSLSGK